MTTKALIAIDLEIARLREDCNDGRANNLTIARLKELLKQREELLPQLLAERSRECSFAA